MHSTRHLLKLHLECYIRQLVIMFRYVEEFEVNFFLYFTKCSNRREVNSRGTLSTGRLAGPRVHANITLSCEK